MSGDPLKAIFTQKPIHLLLVEDEEAHLELVQRALEGQTTPVHLAIACSLHEAREYLRTSTPDLIIADIRLPDGDGIELLPRKTSISFPVIVMTSYGDEKMAVEAMKAGALDYIVKSGAAFNDIPHVVERALRQWHEITERKRAEQEIRVHAKQLMALSHLSYQVLSGIEIDALIKEAANLIAKTLKVKYVQILELLPDLKTLRVRAATGWQSSLFSQATSIIDYDSLTRHVLASGEAVFIEDLRTDERFKESSSLLEQHGLISGAILPLSGQDRCLGVLWACSDQPWVLINNGNDISFLRSIGNTVAVAMERTEAETQMRKLQNDLFKANQLSTVGELGATLVHEVNQPITAVINYVRACQQMIMTNKEQTTQTIYALMDKAVTEAERAASIIHHLWEFARTGKLRRTPETLSMIVYNASRLALEEATEDIIKANFELDSQLPLVYIDKIQIQQVVFNLVRNAVEALIGSEEKLITIKAILIQNHAVEVQVQDTGPGINPALTDKIFKQRFSTKDKGMGMGLAISYSIIKAHKGDLWISDTPGGGATFHFTVPTAESSPAVESQ
jgi:signal transduction histidine kinase/DNA-binding response OmpR family regulator